MDPKVLKALILNWEATVSGLTQAVLEQKAKTEALTRQYDADIAQLKREMEEIKKDKAAQKKYNVLKPPGAAVDELSKKVAELIKQFDTEKKDKDSVKNDIAELTKTAEFGKRDLGIANKKIKLNAMKIAGAEKKIEELVKKSHHKPKPPPPPKKPAQSKPAKAKKKPKKKPQAKPQPQPQPASGAANSGKLLVVFHLLGEAEVSF